MTGRSFYGYNDYIFDLYGTLIDVHTDEGAPEFWQKMSEWYAVFGADYDPYALGEKYRQTVAEEEQELGEATGAALPEIKLESVFLELLGEAPRRHDAKLPDDMDAWARDTANVFRILSRDRLVPYDGAKELLEKLRKLGKRTFLLSNAQSVFTVPEIEICGLSGLFDGMWLSSDHGVKKPEPSFMEGLIAEYGIEKRGAVMIGNDPYADMGAAAACGVDGVWVNSDRRGEYEKEVFRGMIRESYGDAYIAEVESIKDMI